YTTGKFGQALTLNGTNQGVTVPYSATMPTSAYTISFWENVNSYTNVSNPTFFSTRDGGFNCIDIQLTSTGGLHGDIGGGGTGGAWLTTGANTSQVLGLNTWNMVTETVNSSGYAIYINGALATGGSGTWSGTPSFMQSSSTLTIGE